MDIPLSAACKSKRINIDLCESRDDPLEHLEMNKRRRTVRKDKRSLKPATLGLFMWSLLVEVSEELANIKEQSTEI